MGFELLWALGAAVAAALAGWPVTGWVLRGAARERSGGAASKGSRLWTPGAGPDAVTDPGEASAEPDTASPAERPDPTPASVNLPACRRGDSISTPGLLRGGLAIGLLERFLVAGGIAMGQPAILAVVVAVKGLGRIPELRNTPAAGERFIIGTFASLAVAGIVGYAGHFLAAAT